MARQLPVLNAIVQCEKQTHLLELYRLAVHDYSYANELVSQARGHSDLLEAAHRRVDDAKIRVDAARQALMRHREEHGC